MARVRTGAIGWSYPDWRGPFYSRDAADSRLLEQYAQVFDCLELDTTFYAVPRPQTLRGWERQTPPEFRFSAKLPRLITHERRLIGPAAVQEALDFAALLTTELGPKLGTLLIQLPPELAPEERRLLLEFADAIAEPRFPWVVELRHEGWKATEIVALLAERQIGVATTDRVDLGAPLRYVRLLGEENAFPRFDQRVLVRDSELDQWAERLRSAPAAAEICVHIRNFYEGHAPATLTALRERLGLPTTLPPGQQQLALF